MNNRYNFIENIETARLLVIGDVILDRFIYGDVDRISPEGPIPVLACAKDKAMLGGAGNVWANIHALGAQAILLSVIGKDLAGEDIRQFMENRGADSGYLIENTARPTILKTRYIAQNQQLLRVDKEVTDDIALEVQDEIFEKTKSLIESIDILILSDYGKGLLTDDLTKKLIKLATDNNTPVIIDPKGKDYSKYKGASYITPNRKELSLATSMPVDTDSEIEQAAQYIRDTYNIATVIATRSEKGMSIIADDMTLHVPTKAQEVFDVSGAGDTVVATLATCLAAKADIQTAIEITNIAGGLVVAKMGTATVTRQEIKTALQALPSENKENSFISPICGHDWDAAKAHIENWQAQGLKIGATGGCFDIIHYGHVNYLARARVKCDRLILVLNHDESVRILKGDSRPINDETARANVMAALSSVDMVVFFGAQKPEGDNTPCAILDYLRPDIFFKGGDYSLDDLPEGKIVTQYGGIVDIMPLYEGYSTTDIIKKSQQ